MNSVDIEYENIQKIIDVNEIKTSSKFYSVSAVKLDKNEEETVQHKWYQNYSLQNEYLRQNESLNEPKNGLAALGVSEDCDIRPKIYDKIEKVWTLCDSGSVVSCVPKKPGDKIDPSIRLRSVNGGIIPTFGSEELIIRLGRKQYKIQAIKADVPQRILGWDFFRKHKLDLEWGEFGDLFIVDKVAKIKSLVKYEEVKNEEVNAVDCYEEPAETNVSPQTVYFQTECMKALETMADETDAGETDAGQQISAMTIHPDNPSPFAEDIPLGPDIEDSNEIHKANLKALKKIKEPFASLIKEHSSILEANFKKEPSKDIYHRIETTGEPFKSKVRPLLASSEKSEKGKVIWQQMEKLGVIERVPQNTTLKYTSPLHLVRKPNSNGWRVCADFRLLNLQTTSDNYPLPLLRSFQNQIRGAKYFSVIDLKSAFHHLPIHPDDVSKTCVLSPWGGAFVFRRLAFGLSNGPASWQKYVDSVLSGIENTFCYLDDILIWSETLEEHMSIVKKIFKRLEENEITLALDKCVFAEETVDYLGYQVNGTGIRPLRRKTEAIDKIPAPTTQKKLLQFLGALNYFRSSLSGLKKDGKYQNAANLLQPLYSAATVPIPAGKFQAVWDNSPIIQQAFVDAKLLLKQAAELSHPDPSLPLALMTDASQHSIGSVLLQRSTKGKWTPLGYMSRHLTADKARWSTCRKELLAAQAGLRHFITEIYGRHCTIFSDHAPLVLAFKNPQGFQLHDPVAQRALVEIGQFTKDVRHVAGLANVGSDFLSRIPEELKGSAYNEDAGALTNEMANFKQVAALEGHKLQCMSPTVISEAQKDCKEVELIEAGRHPSSVIFQRIKFQESELLCEVSLSKPRPFLPKSLRQFVMQQMHYAHDGIKESVRQISSHYYWTEMKKEITSFVQSCHGCQSQKSSNQKPPHYGVFEVPDQRFTHCHVDIVGPLPESEGFKYILSIIDRTTRQLSALPLKEPSAKSCSQAFLLHYVALYGIPSACTSDQGSNFVSSLFQEMQNSLGIKINHTPIYWPQGNGLIERSHRTLKDKIKAQLVEMGDNFQDKWIQALPWALLGQRTAYNKDLGTSSSELTLGTHIQVPGSMLQEEFSAEPNISATLQKLQIKDNRVAIPTSTNPQKEIDPPKDATHVYTRQHDTRGLQSRYKGPYRILSRPTRSSLEIKVGLNSNGSERKELRAWADCKKGYLRDNQADAERPKRGRPPKSPPSEPIQPSSPSPSSSSDPSDASSTGNHNNNKPPNLPNSNDGGNLSRPTRSTRNPAPNYVDALVASIDFSKPPPSYPPSTTWTASRQELEDINRSIRGY